MELALYKFVSNGVQVYAGYKNQVPEVQGQLVQIIEVPSRVTLDLLIGSTLSGIVIQPAPYIKGI